MTSEEKNELKLGVLSYQEIKELIADNVISSVDPSKPITDAQIQPASLDLRLGTKVYRVISSFLPENQNVADLLQQERFTEHMHDNMVVYDLDITEPRVLEKGQIYLIPLMEQLNLPKTRKKSEKIRGRANPKSTTGRLDIFTRVITDKNNRFDDIAPSYNGQLYLEVMPISFPIKVQAGQRLVQLRLIRGSGIYTLPTLPLKQLFKKENLLYFNDSPVKFQKKLFSSDGGLFMSVDLSGDKNGIVGYKSKSSSHYVDLAQINYYDVEEFWEPIYKKTVYKTLILQPEKFYILASKEKIRIPNQYAAELVPFEAGSGELRTHYAGFFDPGFGYGTDGEIKGTKAVLEVRARDAPFMIADGQTFCKLNFEKMASRPDILYGADIGSSYQGQGIKLSKQFKDGQN